MGQLIIVALIIVVYLLHEYWKARQNQLEEDEPSWPNQPPRPPSGAPPLPRPGSARMPAPPPPVPSRPLSWQEELRRSLPQPPALPTVVPRAAEPAPKIDEGEDPDMQKGLPVHMPSLQESAQAFLRASRLEDRVGEQLRRVQDLVTTHQKFEVKKVTAPEVRQALELLRGRSSQRAAIMASVILGPPRAMEV